MKQDLQRNMLRDRVVELSGAIEISDEEVRKYYDEKPEAFHPEGTRKASRILVRVSPKATDAGKLDAMKKAKAIRKKAAKKALICGPEQRALHAAGSRSWWSSGLP